MTDLVSIEEISSTETLVEWNNGIKSTFHNIWLRDNCHCDKCYYPATKQRLLDSSTLSSDIKPTSILLTGNTVSIVWDQDSHKSGYDSSWLKIHAYNPRLIPLESKLKGEANVLAFKHWNVEQIEKDLPKVDFNDVMACKDDSVVKDWCLKIWQYGFCLIDNVPVTPEDTQVLCEKLDYIRPTHYGGFWDFTSDLSKADTAYTNIDISNHTDGTYWSDTPGLQLFHLLYHDGTGGTTSLVDSFRCAQIMKEKYPESYEIFTKIPIPAHSAGEETVCIQPAIPQPIFKLDNHGKLVQIRWNQSDRSTMDYWEDPADLPKFYQAIKHWVSLINDPKNEFFYQLKPGQCLIFDNWRVFHSRTEFTGKRRMCGAYHNRDDFVSKLKLLNLGREAVLDAI